MKKCMLLYVVFVLCFENVGFFFLGTWWERPVFAIQFTAVVVFVSSF